MTIEEIELICIKHSIRYYTINENDMSVNIEMSAFFDNLNLKELPIKINKVEGHLDIKYNKFENLNNMPKEVNGSFMCNNNKLTSLEGIPNVIYGNIYCENNNIKSFKGVHEDFKGFIKCIDNPVIEVVKALNTINNYNKTMIDHKCIYWLNEFDVIQGDNVIMDRLEEVFHQLEKPIPNIKEIKGYNLI